MYSTTCVLKINVLVRVLYVFAHCFCLICAYPKHVPIGAIFTPQDAQAHTRHFLNLAIDRHNVQGNRTANFLLDSFQKNLRDVDDENDSWQLARTACNLLEKAFFVFMAASRKNSYATYQAFMERVNVPFINWNLPSRSTVGPAHLMELSMRIPLYRAVGDVVRVKNWTRVAYLYDSEEALLNMERMMHWLRGENYTLTIDAIQMDLVQPYNFFIKFHRTRLSGDENVHVILDITSSSDQRRVLRHLVSVSQRSRSFHYILANLNFEVTDFDEFRDGVINITAFRLPGIKVGQQIHAATLSVIGGAPVAEEYLTTEAAYVYDAVQVVAEGVDKMLAFGDSRLLDGYFRDGEIYTTVHGEPRSGINCWHGGLNKTDGQTLAKFLRKVNFDGLSGHVEFGSDGLRRNFTIEVLELLFTPIAPSVLSSNQKTPVRWNDIVGFKTDVYSSDTAERNTTLPTRRKYRVVTVLNKPFVSIKEKDKDTNCTGIECLEGFCIDLLEKMKDPEVFPGGFNYEIHLQKKNDYGSQSGGEWNGMIGELLSGEADLAVADLTITKARERVVDFSKPFFALGITIMIKKPDKQEFSVFSFMSPLSMEIWIYLILAYIGISLVIFFVARVSPYEWRIEETPSGGFTISNDFSIYNSLWFTLAAFMQQGTDLVPRSISGRIASSAWWFFTMIIVSSYTANLAAFLTLERMQTPIENVDQLSKQDKIKYGIKATGSTADFFRDSIFITYQRMWQYMNMHRSTVMVDSYEQGIQKVRDAKGRYAFLLESTVNEYINNRKPCDTMRVSSERLNNVGYGVATPFGSEIRDHINLAILHLQEKGELKNLENKWWYDRGECEQGRSDSQKSALNLSKVAGVFYILIGGMILSMATSMGEFLYRARKEAERRKKEGGLSSIMKKHFGPPRGAVDNLQNQGSLALLLDGIPALEYQDPNYLDIPSPRPEKTSFTAV